MSLHSKKTALFFIACLTCLAVIAQEKSAPAFPLRLSGNGRYLTDRNGKPFLIREISAWGLIQALSEADEEAFLDSVKDLGFNTVMVSIISFDTRFAGRPPNWEGISPFRKPWDFSTFNPAYFEHADRFLKLAMDKGFLVLLVPCYLGYKGDINQGWANKLLMPSNSPEKSGSYGQFLSKHYAGFVNLIWVAGGDNRGDGPLYAHMNAIIHGIKSFDSVHLWTGHFESAEPTNWSTGNPLYTSSIDLDGLYDFVESDLGAEAPQYRTEMKQYGRGKMIFQLDQSYEHDIPHGPDNEDPAHIRRKNYDGLLTGCAGTSFSPGLPGNPCYTFIDWKPLMRTQGMWEMKYCFEFFQSIQWYDLVPLTGDSLIPTGRGAWGTVDYVCAAVNLDLSMLVAYLPTARTLQIDLARLKGKSVTATWLDPQTGKRQKAGNFRTQGRINLAPPASGDWVLLIQATSDPS